MSCWANFKLLLCIREATKTSKTVFPDNARPNFPMIPDIHGFGTVLMSVPLMCKFESDFLYSNNFEHRLCHR